MPNPSYVIASCGPWNRDLAKRLTTRCGRPFYQVSDAGELADALQRQSPRFVFFPHWSTRLPEDIWSKHECVIFHMTDLPYGRGGSPLQNLIVRGHESTVICALRCVRDFDAGPVYLRRPLSLLGAAEEILLRADRAIEEMIAEIVERDPAPVPQAGEATVFRRRELADGALHGGMTLDEVYDRVRMLDASGYPPAYFEVGQLRLELTRVSRRVDRLEANIVIRLSGEESKA